jgi:4-aminobutyrate aminotransferase-like enzyme
MLSGLKALQLRFPWIREVRGRGAMVGVELEQDWSSKGIEISQRLLDKGFIVNYHSPTSTFRLFPPFIISTQEIDTFLKALEQTLT